MLRRDVHRGDAAVRRASDMELARFDLVSGADVVEELREDAVAVVEE